MKQELKRIERFFDDVCNHFENVHLKCEFQEEQNMYIIDVSPSAFFDENKAYTEMEYDFCSSFEDEYPDIELLFVSNDPLFKVENPILEKQKVPEETTHFTLEDNIGTDANFVFCFENEELENEWTSSVCNKLSKAA